MTSELCLLLPALRRRALSLTRHPARADDLVQDAVVRALRFRTSFQPGSSLRAWVLRILENAFISERRRHGTEHRVLELSRFDPNGWTCRESTELEIGLGLPVERALGRLPDHFSAVIRLVDLEELSYRDAAELLGVPVGTVMSRLHRGRSRLKLELGMQGKEAA